MRRGLFDFWIDYTITICGGIDDHGLVGRPHVGRSTLKPTNKMANSAVSSLIEAWVLAHLGTHACNTRMIITTNYGGAEERTLQNAL